MDTDIETRILDFIPKTFLVMTIVSACFLSLQNPVRKSIEITLTLIVLTSTSYFLVYGVIDKSKGVMLLSGVIAIIYASLLYFYWNKRPVEY